MLYLGFYDDGYMPHSETSPTSPTGYQDGMNYDEQQSTTSPVQPPPYHDLDLPAYRQQRSRQIDRSLSNQHMAAAESNNRSGTQTMPSRRLKLNPRLSEYDSEASVEV